MRIAYISFIKDPWGGSEELWARSAEEALKQGHEVIINAVKLNVPSPRLDAFARMGAMVQYRRGFINPAWSRRERIFRKIILFIKDRLSNPFGELIRSNPDIVVYTGAAYSMLLNETIFNPLVRGWKPYINIIQVNSEYGRPVNNEEALWLRDVYEAAASNVFVSVRNKETVERHILKALPYPQNIIIGNPVNLAYPDQIVPFPSTEGGFRIAIVANLLVNHKGQDLAFHIFREDKWRERHVSLHLYGSGHDEHYLKQLAEFYGLVDRVHFHGRVSDIRGVWAENHLMLLPSLNEGTPLALVEAMLCGRPSVVTDVGDNAAWVREGIDGFVAGGANIHAIDEALERAWEKREEWRSMGRAAHDRAMGMHDPVPGKTLLNLILKHGRRS